MPDDLEQRINRPDQSRARPAVSRGSIRVWHDTTDNKVYLLFKRADGTDHKVEIPEG